MDSMEQSSKRNIYKLCSKSLQLNLSWIINTLTETNILLNDYPF